jgi:hypothetical protein
MPKRNPIAVLLLSIITFGIYWLIWHVKTKREMVACGADIPTSWLLILPIANIYWLWKWAGGVEHVSRGKMSQAVAFLVAWLLPYIGTAILQDTLNKSIDAGLPSALPEARVA